MLSSPTYSHEAAHRFDRKFAPLPVGTLLARLIFDEFSGRIALVSSFGIESAVLLHMIAEIEPSTPVLFIDTGQLFEETLAYRDQLVARLGLRDIRRVGPSSVAVAARDPDGFLWQTDPDACCRLRKVEPLDSALQGFDAWINGRKRAHGGQRSALPVIEASGGRIKVNPLAAWDRSMVEAYMATHRLPAHPMQAMGYESIGCMPCSDRTQPGEGPRDGRWRGTGKTECGIHLPRN
jgi:phosphoadenosine phosphosulfate reductase